MRRSIMKRKGLIVVLTIITLLCQQAVPVFADIDEPEETRGIITLGNEVNYEGTDEGDVTVTQKDPLHPEDGLQVQINEGGVYDVTGSVSDCSIVLDSVDVRLVLHDLTLTNSSMTRNYFYVKDSDAIIDFGDNTNLESPLKTPFYSTDSNLTINGNEGRFSFECKEPFVYTDGGSLDIMKMNLEIEFAEPTNIIEGNGSEISIDTSSISCISDNIKSGIINPNGNVVLKDSELDFTNCSEEAICAEAYEQTGGIVNISTYSPSANIAYYKNEEYNESSSTDYNYIWNTSNSENYRINLEHKSYAGIVVGHEGVTIGSTPQEPTGSFVINSGELNIDTSATGLKTNIIVSGDPKHPNGSDYVNETTDTPYIIGEPANAITCYNVAEINGGNLSIKSGADGIQAKDLHIAGDTILNIDQAYNGLNAQNLSIDYVDSKQPTVTVSALNNSVNVKNIANYQSNSGTYGYTKTVQTVSGCEFSMETGNVYLEVISEPIECKLEDSTFNVKGKGNDIYCLGDFELNTGDLYVVNGSSEDRTPFKVTGDFTFNGGKFKGIGYNTISDNTVPTGDSKPYITRDVDFSKGDVISIMAGESTKDAFTAKCLGSYIVYGADDLTSKDYTIRVPSDNVTPTPDPTTTKYKITKALTDSGISSISIKSNNTEVTEAESGAVLTINVTPASGFTVDTITVTSNFGTVNVENCGTYTMPSSDIIVTAIGKAITDPDPDPTPSYIYYPIYNSTTDSRIASVAITRNGSVATSAKENDVIAVRATPVAGAQLKDISVIYNTGDVITIANGSTFIMKNCSATVIARTVPSEETEPEPDPDDKIEHYEHYDVDSDGNITFTATNVVLYANGDLKVPGYSLQLIEDAQVLSDGSIRYKDGFILRLDQSIVLPNGDILNVDGTIEKAKPDNPPQPDSDEKYTVNADGSVTTGNGVVIPAYMIIHNTDGTMTLPNGVRINTDGSLYIEPQQNSVSANVSINKITKELSGGYTVTYTEKVSYNGLKHVATFMDEKSKTIPDIDIVVKDGNGVTIDPSEYKVTFKNNKNVKSKKGPYFKLNIKTANKSSRKAIKKMICKFTIEPLDLTGKILEAETCKKSHGKYIVKKCTYNDAKFKYSRKKSKSCDIYGGKLSETSKQYIVVNGANNCTGTARIELTE